MLIIGITGTLACGKSTVSEKFKKDLNAEIINADVIAHNFLLSDAQTHKEVVSVFGKDILNDTLKIDRKKLAKIVFSDKECLKRLCSILHPKIINTIKNNIRNVKEKNKGKDIIIDAPLLLETGLGDSCDCVVVVASDIKNILIRAKKKYGLCTDEALKRVRAQMPVSEKIKYADYVIENNGTLRELDKKIEQITQNIKK